MKAIVALILLGTTTQALAEPPVDLKAAVLVPKAGPSRTVEGGVWLSSEETIRLAAKLADCSTKEAGPAQLALQKALQEPPKTEGSWVVPTAIGLSIGLLGGFLWGFSMK